MFRTVTMTEAQALPRWRRPAALLLLMAFAMPLAFSTWSALLNNFVIEMAGFTGVEIGWLHSIREVPGLLAVSVILLLLIVGEQALAAMMLVLLGASTAVTAWFPSFQGILIITLLSSIGFHYYETVNQSLQLQWLEKATAPKMMGRLLAATGAVGGVTTASVLFFFLSFLRGRRSSAEAGTATASSSSMVRRVLIG